MTSTPGPAPLINGVDSTGEHSVIGINFGNSYSSIAVINKEGRADCIANEDGERQIASAIAFNGSETYIGNQALPQLVKNSHNTILGFRNFLGKTFEEITEQPTHSAQLYNISGIPSYSVKFDSTTPLSLPPTPSPTPPSEPTTKHFTVHEITALFLRSLQQSAQDFLSARQIRGAVLSCPAWFDEKQREALLAAAKDAGINVLQLVDEGAAAVVAYAPSSASPAVEPLKAAIANGETASLPVDRKTLIVDLGASSLTLTLMSLTDSLMHVLHRTHTTALGGHQLDDVLVAHFAKEFTKKTSVPLSLTSSSPQDLRALAKLRQACELTKRTLSASTGGSGTCDVESLKEGADFHGTINNLRFDLLARTVYQGVVGKVKDCLEGAGMDPVHLDEVVLVGGTASLPGVAEALRNILDPTTTITSTLVPSQVIAIGCALQARLLTLYPSYPTSGTELEGVVKAPTTTQPIGLVFPGAKVDEDTPEFYEIVKRETPLPVRRRARFAVPDGVKRVGVEVWEGREDVKVEKVSMPPLEDEPEELLDEEDEEPEEEEERTRVLRKVVLLAGLVIDFEHDPSQANLSGKKKKKAAKVAPEAEVEIVLEEDGRIRIRLTQVGREQAGSEVVV